MTDQEVREIFAELRRVGYDVSLPPGLAVGTGFAAGELVAWLRTQADAAGHDAIVAAMNAHTAAASSVPDSVRARSGAPFSGRMYPTHEQLAGAVRVLIDEWDPLGARLGALSNDDASEHAFQLLMFILACPPEVDTEANVARALGQLEESTFGVRQSPVEQRRYLARRLMRVVVDHPLPAEAGPLPDLPVDVMRPALDGPRAMDSGHTRTKGRSRSQRVVLGPRGDEPSPLDPLASCSDCGTTGTVAVVTRDREPALSRYCIDCWRRVRSRYLGIGARLPSTSPSSPAEMIDFMERFDALASERQRYAASALWEDVVSSLGGWLTPTSDAAPASRNERHLTSIARELARRAPGMYGPMPREVADFIDRYGGA